MLRWLLCYCSAPPLIAPPLLVLFSLGASIGVMAGACILELILVYPCNQNEGKALDILQKGAQSCLWYHQLLLKMVMEVNDHICRGRLREFEVGIEALSHPSVGLSLDLHISAPSSSVLWICRHPWIQELAKKWADFSYLVPTQWVPRAGCLSCPGYGHVVGNVLKMQQLLFVLEKHRIFCQDKHFQKCMASVTATVLRRT